MEEDKEDIYYIIGESIRAWFEGQHPEELKKASSGRTKYTKKYFDSVEKDYGEVTELE